MEQLKEPNGEPKPGAAPQAFNALVEKYPASFSGADVIVFGISEDGQETSARKEETFSAFFLKSWAHLRSFSPALAQQDSYLFPLAIRSDGNFEGGGAQGALKLALFTAKQGDVADGWLAFNVGRETLCMPFHGEYHCSDDDCLLSAICNQSVPPDSSAPYFRNGDRLVLKGRRGILEGSLQAAARETFKDLNQTVVYSLKFSSPR